MIFSILAFIHSKYPAYQALQLQAKNYLTLLFYQASIKAHYGQIPLQNASSMCYQQTQPATAMNLRSSSLRLLWQMRLLWLSQLTIY